MARITRDLCEAFGTGQAHKVDRAAGVIAGVKVCGEESPNRHGLTGVDGTRYSKAALQAALPLYEGRKVYIDHPPRNNPEIERSVRDLAGVLRGARVEADGVYANLHFPPNSETGKHIADLAESMPECFGLSHNARGVGRVVGGKYLIESIQSVRSVDIVTSPATTRGLYESQERPMAKKTLKQVVEDLKFSQPVKAKLLEMDGADAPLPDVGGDSGGSYKDHLGEAIKAVLADDSLDIAAKKKKILAIIKASDDETPAADPPADPPASDSSASDTDKMESLEREIAALKREKEIRELCEAEEFKPTAVQLKALNVLEAADRKEFIADAKKVAAPAKAAIGPKTGSRNLTESADTTDAKAWLNRLKSSVLN